MKISYLLNACTAALVLTCSLPAFAESGLFCHGASDEQSQDRAQLAESISKSYFYDYRYPDDWNDNPKLENGHFKQARQYLVSGDRLVVGPEQRGYRCGYYISDKGIQTANWVKADAVRVLDAVSPADWQGEWSTSDSHRQLKITKNQAKYEFVGGGREPGNLRFIFPFTLPKNRQDVRLVSRQPTDTPCALELQRLGEYMIVTNGVSCGLDNADPDGVLRKR
jgi:hypothetical protein